MRALLCLAALALAACATSPSERGYSSWGHAGPTREADFLMDRAACFHETMRVDTIMQTPPRKLVTVDEKAFAACMKQRGWSLR